ncbi:MAG TPA: cystathionine beta-lyase [Alphaproteobacteria bacterium]|nr:cystathionine beta-lyase [Alphaproteobacteria bacterium]
MHIMQKKPRPDTLLVSAGRDPHANQGVVNPPVYHASTIIFPTVAELHASQKNKDPRKTRYGRHGTPTTFALEEAIASLEGGAEAIAMGSGVAAITAILTAFVKTGDHLLMVDTAYGPTRRFCDTVLKRFGVATTYYDPRVGAGIAELIRPNTRLIFLESPGSLTFEVQDVPAIAAVARKAGIVTAMDNTWATPLYFKPLAHGVDVSVLSATKYIGGHSDLMMGLITTTAAAYPPVRRAVEDFGGSAAPDDCYLALRGYRTLAVRLARHHENGLKLAQWLRQRPEVARVLHPALPDSPDHALWRRDFTGASGLFAIELQPVREPAVAAMLDGLELFGMGYSWGGFESLILPIDPSHYRTAVPWKAPGPLIRIHAGLEDPQDLIADLEAGFARLREAAKRP